MSKNLVSPVTGEKRRKANRSVRCQCGLLFNAVGHRATGVDHTNFCAVCTVQARAFARLLAFRSGLLRHIDDEWTGSNLVFDAQTMPLAGRVAA